MFIERSSARIRMVRTLFVLLGVVPCAGLCGWAVMRHSATHRREFERRCEHVLGLPVQIGRVEHVRPDAVRLHDCVLASADGATILAGAVVDVESSSTEVRVRLGRIACSPRLARAVTALVHQWLGQPARFPLDCVVEVEELSWRADAASPSTGAQDAGRLPGLRIECVAAAGARAVRLSGGGSVDGAARGLELRVIATNAAGMEGVDERSGARVEVTGTVASFVPLAILEACVGFDSGALALGADAVVGGRIESSREGGQWSGTADGRVERIDLAAATAHLPYRMSGEATLVIDGVAWTGGRIDTCDCRFTATRGAVEQPLLNAFVSAIGCRPGPEHRPAAGERTRGFDEAACRLRIGPAGVALHADPGRRSAIAVVRGRAILEEPPTAVPLERIAWLLSPPSAVAVPASKATRWLLGTFSDEVLVGAGQTREFGRNSERDSVRTPSEQAGRPANRSDF